MAGRTFARFFTTLYLLQTLLATLPAYAQVTGAPGAPSGQKPLIDAAANGVPLVLIAPPNASGVSRNQYGQFNVTPSGLILNNATGNAQTQLGGWVKGNMLLGATPARIILNEVTGNSSSQLRGVIEVAGQRADVVIANPNGIRCEGCGFLNTSRATLSTGVPLFNGSGALTGFDVRQGVLHIGAGGLSAMEQQQLDLHARSLSVEGEVWTQNLQAILGANQIQHGAPGSAPVATPHAPGAVSGAATGDTPRFAVDIKALGGMYAGSIYLIATDKGLGVNSTGRLATLAGNLELSANGELTLKDSYSAADTRITAQGQVSLTGQNQAEGSLKVQGQGVRTAGASVLAQRLEMDAGTGALHNEAGTLKATSTSTTPGAEAIRLSATGIRNEAGAIQANGAVLLDARGGGLHNAGGLLTGGAVTALNAQEVYNQAGTVYSATELNLTTGALYNAAGKLQATGRLNAVAQGISNAGGTIAANGDVLVNAGTGDLRNEGGLIYSAQGEARIVAGPLHNTGGVLAAATALTVESGALYNTEGVISGAHAARISVSGLTNDAGLIEAGAGGLTLNTQGQALRNAASGSARGIVSSGGLSITAGEVINTSVPGGTGGAGYIGAGGTLTVIASGNITNTAGAVITAAAASVQAGGDITNAGFITAGSTTLRATGEVANAGLINSTEGATAITAAALRNTGRIYGDSVTITAPVYNSSAADTGAGAVIASRSGDIRIDGPVSNTAGSLILSLNDLTVSGAVANHGATLSAARDLSIGGALSNTNAGLSLASLTRHDATGGFYIQPAGSTVSYRPEELLYVPRESGFWILPSSTYPLAQFGGLARALMSDCVYPVDGYPTEARETASSEQEQKFRQSGIAVTITNPLVSALETTGRMARQAENTDDPRMKALAVAAAALAINDAATAIAKEPGKLGGVGINFTLGTRQQQSTASESSNRSAGSTVAAGGNVTITARGDGDGPGKSSNPLPNDPGAYVVPMGRVVGTAGETSIKIIVRPGTNKIITAYPFQ